MREMGKSNNMPRGGILFVVRQKKGRECIDGEKRVPVFFLTSSIQDVEESDLLVDHALFAV
jgi:hypothetical protein